MSIFRRIALLFAIFFAANSSCFAQEASNATETAVPASANEVADEEQEGGSISERINARFGVLVEYMATVLFWQPGPFSEGAKPWIPVPLIVLILLSGSLYFTFFHGWLNIRAFRHAIDVTRGRYDNPDDPGEISHFQALTSALSATVGLGNIASVAIAINEGGPGAVIWMMLLGILGMSAKFNECTLAQVYRKISPDGTVHGGPMYYLEIGLHEKGFPKFIAKAFGVIFALFCIGGSFGGGNMFQANQATSAVAGMVTETESLRSFGEKEVFPWIVGGVLCFLVGLVIVGGIKRIGRVTEKIIPFMCGIYLLTGLWILMTHATELPAAFALIWKSCWNADAAYGGFLGVMVLGIKRAVFSNEAGVGSAAIAHAAAKTDEPVREGVVAMLGPFIDTVVICTMTALVVIVTGAYNNPDAGKGVEMTRWAFAGTVSWFPLILTLSVFLLHDDQLVVLWRESVAVHLWWVTCFDNVVSHYFPCMHCSWSHYVT
jgi:AGCS family alanine or glycine:cation symporter